LFVQRAEQSSQPAAGATDQHGSEGTTGVKDQAVSQHEKEKLELLLRMHKGLRLDLKG
jgi:hypothetical protein